MTSTCFDEQAKVSDIFRSHKTADLQSLGGEDYVSVERLGSAVGVPRFRASAHN
ncbi:MAG TPA: hypothetical protein VKM93_27010 [Terriglobia bacterium]|nr:hypothetical protein [Terriglobia bacterium]